MQACNFYKQGSCFPSGSTCMETHVRMKPKTCTRGPLKPRYLCFCSAFLALFKSPHRHCLGIDSLFQDKLFTGLKGSLFSSAAPRRCLLCLSLGCALLFQRARSGEEEAEDVNSHVETQRERKEDLFILLLNAPLADREISSCSRVKH